VISGNKTPRVVVVVVAVYGSAERAADIAADVRLLETFLRWNMPSSSSSSSMRHLMVSRLL